MNSTPSIRYNETGYIETYTGRLLTPLDPDPADMSVQDIAHALAMKCRYSGHSRNFYSVAEHSVLMAEWFEKQDCAFRALYALLHDANEAYLPDVPSPVKQALPWWAEIEGRMDKAVMRFFNCYLLRDRAIMSDVKRADTRIKLAEAESLLVSGGMSFGAWAQDFTPLPVQVRCWTPARAKQAWLDAYDRLKDESMPERVGS